MYAHLAIPMQRQEGSQVDLGNPHGSTKAVGDKFTDIDPTAHCARANAERLSDFKDGEEIEVIAPAGARIGSQGHGRARACFSGAPAC
jgi:hypothetical protein